MIKFFKPEEEERIISAIQSAEKNTSGEIRVHLEDNSKGDIMEEAIQTFARLNMDKTEARNGVLIFLAPERKRFAIIGDEGINRLVPDNFWEEEKKVMMQHFRAQQFCEGICKAIQLVGDRLKTHFPYQKGDINELPDDISYS